MKKRLFIQTGFRAVTNGHTDGGISSSLVAQTQSRNAAALSHTHLVVVLAGHDVGKGDLGLEHLPAVHELHQQVAHSLELHPLCRLDVGQDETRKDLEAGGNQKQVGLCYHLKTEGVFTPGC